MPKVLTMFKVQSEVFIYLDIFDECDILYTDGLEWLEDDDVVVRNLQNPFTPNRNDTWSGMRYRKSSRRDPKVHFINNRFVLNYPNFKSRKRDKARERLRMKRSFQKSLQKSLVEYE